jgi:hypothetical protein
VQELVVGSVFAQLLVSAKSLGLAPPSEMEMLASVALPLSVKVMVCAVAVLPADVLGKVMLVAERVACGTDAAVPVPLRVTLCGEPVALSATVIVAGKLAALCGLKAMVNVQFAAAARELPQVLSMEKSLVSLSTMLVNVRLALPLLVSVRAWVALV